MNCKPHRWLAGLMALAVAATFSLTGCTFESSSSGTPQPPKPVELLEISPGELKQKVAEHKDKIVLVDFWATWCAPCVEKLPKVIELQEKYGAQGLVVLTVSMDDPDAKDEALQVLKDVDANPLVNYINTDDAEDAWTQYGIVGDSVPHYQLYGRDGELIDKFYFDPNDAAPSPDSLVERVSELFKK